MHTIMHCVGPTTVKRPFCTFYMSLQLQEILADHSHGNQRNLHSNKGTKNPTVVKNCVKRTI